MYKHILNMKLNEWDFAANKSIQNFGMRAGFQDCINRRLRKEFQRADLISSNPAQIFKKKQSFQKGGKKRILSASIVKMNESADEIKNHPKQGVKGVRADGFDLYKPTRMLKQKVWQARDKRQPVKGVVLKAKQGHAEHRASKDDLFQRVFLEKKVKEIGEMEKELKMSLRANGMSRDDIKEKASVAQLNNQQILRKLNDFTVEPEFGRRTNSRDSEKKEIRSEQEKSDSSNPGTVEPRTERGPERRREGRAGEGDGARGVDGAAEDQVVLQNEGAEQADALAADDGPVELAEPKNEDFQNFFGENQEFGVEVRARLDSEFQGRIQSAKQG